jgi:hypothetical protein
MPSDHFTKDKSVLYKEFSLIVLLKFPIITQIIETFRIGKKVFLEITDTKNEVSAVIGLNNKLPKPPANSESVIKVGKQSSTVFDMFVIKLLVSKNTFEISFEINKTTIK